MARRRTRGEAHIEALLNQLDPGSERYRVLRATADFKASWVELGERLTEVREHGTFKEWGYTNFESYCRQELRLKGDTANKLTRSYSFLRDHNPESLETREVRELPPLEVVDLLSRARERAKLSDAQFAEVEGSVFEAEKPATKKQLLDRFRELDPETFKPAVKPVRAAGDEDLRKALLLAERLHGLVEGHEELSKPARDGLKKLVTELRGLFEATRKSA